MDLGRSRGRRRPVLTSIKNPKIAAAVRLKKRAFREEDRRFLVEGAQAVGEALASGRPRRRCSPSTNSTRSPFGLGRRASRSMPVSVDVMGKLTSTVTPQGIVGVSPFLDVGIDALPVDGCVAILHEVRDPGNAGTVLRSADAAGAGGVVFTASSVDPYNPKTVRSSAGSIFHLPSCGAQDDGIARCRPRATAACRSSRWTVAAIEDLYTRGSQRPRSRSCSGTRRTAFPRRSWRWRTRGSAFHIAGRRSR